MGPMTPVSGLVFMNDRSGRSTSCVRALFTICLASVFIFSCGEMSNDIDIRVPTWKVKHDVVCNSVGPQGKVDDLHCEVEDIEVANTVQLFGILEELSNTTYFRLFQINLDGKCKFWTKNVSEAKCNSSTEGSETAFGPPKPKTQCSLDLSGQGDGGAKNKFAAQSAPPAGLFGGFPFPMPVTNQVDRTISSKEESSLAISGSQCNDTSLPEFWLDMCRNIPTNTSEYLNLNLNPERWTGYNGSHVWNAIYEENCFEKLGHLDEMCYEERVLYRLLSGLHASTNIHISLEFYPPSKAAGRDKWMPNPERFMNHYGQHPERLKNLHFAFVVLLRAVRKAAPYLYNYPFVVGDADEDRRTTKLVQRLLDSHIMKSCSHVFEAFDETLMFREGDEPSVQATLKSQFKGVFQNISAVMDCISCQKCKLHGKLQLLGLGTALKILLLPEQLISTSLSRSEIVAMFNTMYKFSGAIKAIPYLSSLYWNLQDSYRKNGILEEVTPLEIAQLEALPRPSSIPPAGSRDESSTPQDKLQQTPVEGEDAGFTVAVPPEEAYTHLEAGMAAVASLAGQGVLASKDEDDVIDALVTMDAAVLLLSKYYAKANPQRFVQHVSRSASIIKQRANTRGGRRSVSIPRQQQDPTTLVYDAVIIGGGLAGLSAALTLLDRGGSVAILEKMGHLGGNSAWASSGVNAVDLDDTESADSVASYKADTLKSAQMDANPLVDVLAEGSVGSLTWLRERLKEHLALDLVGQLGGHSHPRTHRPSTGLAGSSMIFAIEKQLNKYMSEASSNVTVMKWTRATRLVTNEDGAVVGVEYEQVKGDLLKGTLRAHNVIVATGGYASDYTEDSLLKKHRPDLLKYATTNTKGTTGDGHKMMIAAGAKALDLQDVQVHPTGFVNPADETNMVKTLCAEILRGEGGILLSRWGKRFVNELGTRDYVTGEMLKTDDELKFAIVLNEAAAKKANTHIGLYTKKGLITKFDTLDALAKWSFWGKGVDAKALENAFKQYDADADKGSDSFGKKFFHSVPFTGAGPWYVGIVTPVIHYCMGGIAISPRGEVLKEDGSVIAGLHAAGEVIGGLHGKNRLGGNALTECVVFGREIGNRLPVGQSQPAKAQGSTAKADAPTSKPAETGPRKIKWDEIAKHVDKNSCWVVLHGKVYDFTEFLDEHPAGPEAILKYAGKDGTEIFDAIHSLTMLDDFKPIGVLAQ